MGRHEEQYFYIEKTKHNVECAVCILSQLGEEPYSDSNDFLFRYTSIPSFVPSYVLRITKEGELIVKLLADKANFIYYSQESDMDFSLENLYEEFLDYKLSTIPSKWFYKTESLPKDSILTYKLELNNKQAWTRSMKYIQDTFREPEKKSTYNRLDGTSHFVELGGDLQKFLYIYDEERYPKLMKFIDKIQSSETAFLQEILREYYTKKTSYFVGVSPDKLAELFQIANLTPQMGAFLYRYLRIPSIKHAIEIYFKDEAKEILLKSVSLEISSIHEESFRTLERAIMKPMLEEERRAGEEKQRLELLNKIRLHNEHLLEVIEDFKNGILHCTRCGNQSEFKIKEPTSEVKGYVICRSCGLSFFKRNLQ